MNDANISTLKNANINLSEQMKIMQRLKNLFVSPNELMNYIKTAPNIIFPMLVMVFFNVGVIIIKFNDYKAIIREQLLLALQGDNIVVTDKMINIMAFLSPILSILVFFISILLSTIIFYGFVKLLKGEGHFKQYASVVLYSSIVNVLGFAILFIFSIYTGKFLFSTNVSIFQILNIKLTDNYFTMLLDKFTISNILGIWQYMLIAIGIVNISKINRKYVYLFTSVVFVITVILLN
ncbi:YIP1 family protein [Clostridium chromiireducens]|uniref:YIP1 family protein n=1 Tax=Clostridium chromiireducens TaxID=225345 RepID=UPI003AF79D87